LESGVENVKIFQLALGDGIERDYDRSPGPGKSFESRGYANRPSVENMALHGAAWRRSAVPRRAAKTVCPASRRQDGKSCRRA
jgi:hypothetical protein